MRSCEALREPRAAEILAIWETGRHQSAVERALTMLKLACPEKDPEELATLPLGRRDELLLASRRRAVGDTLRAVADCPECGEALEFTLSTRDLLRAGEATSDAGELTVDGFEVRFRLLDSRDLIEADECAAAEEARMLLLGRCVLAARRDGRSVPPAELPAAVVEALAQRIAVGDPQCETLLDLCCPACRASWAAELDVAGFFWAELRSEAERLLGEVDALARAYGWSESEILALSAARRSWYLNRVT